MESTLPSEMLPNAADGLPRFYSGKDSCIDSGEDTSSAEFQSWVPVRFSLNGQVYKVLFDSGAGTAIMSSTFLARNFPSADIVPASTAKVVGLCGQKSYMIGHADVSIFVYGSMYSPFDPADPTRRALIVPECLLQYDIRADILGGFNPPFLLIGGRIMHEFNMTLDMGRELLEMSWYSTPGNVKQVATARLCPAQPAQHTEAEGAPAGGQQGPHQANRWGA